MNGSAVGYFDGLCEPRNPGGYACGGWVYAVPGWQDGTPQMGCRCFGNGSGWTNNRAEYEAALACLRAIYRTGYRGEVVLRGDSQLVVRQFTGEYGCNAPGLLPLLAQLRKAAACFASLRLEWVPREENTVADQESRAAYLDATGKEPPTRQRRAG